MWNGMSKLYVGKLGNKRVLDGLDVTEAPRSRVLVLPMPMDE